MKSKGKVKLCLPTKKSTLPFEMRLHSCERRTPEPEQPSSLVIDLTLDSESADPSKTDYQFYQLHPSQGSNYYRLKTVDASGSVSYSRILRIDVNVNGQEMQIYPNPARTTITVGLPAQTQALVQVYNSMGDLVKTKNSINSLLTLDLTGLPAGIFTIRVQQAGSTVTREFVKY